MSNEPLIIKRYRPFPIFWVIGSIIVIGLYTLIGVAFYFGAGGANTIITKRDYEHLEKVFGDKLPSSCKITRAVVRKACLQGEGSAEYTLRCKKSDFMMLLRQSAQNKHRRLRYDYDDAKGPTDLPNDSMVPKSISITTGVSHSLLVIEDRKADVLTIELPR